MCFQVSVRVRPMFVKRPDGTPGREADCTSIVEMTGRQEGLVGSTTVPMAFDSSGPGCVSRVPIARKLTHHAQSRQNP